VSTEATLPTVAVRGGGASNFAGKFEIETSQAQYFRLVLKEFFQLVFAVIGCDIIRQSNKIYSSRNSLDHLSDGRKTV
jgi:hypothetical protein